jgi:DNA mismatch endonuclease (patch repair protein)
VTDVFTAAKRSAIMARIRGKDTAPEMTVRRLLFHMGYRFRVHRKDLPGCPDIVLPRHRAVILVNGCFWHGHSCKRGKQPTSNTEFWTTKIGRNKTRDKKLRKQLNSLGWHVLVVWQCQLQDDLQDRLFRFLRGEQSGQRSA